MAIKIGCSSYSFRKEWKRKYKWDLEGFKELKEKFPEIEGWELLDGHIENEWGETESEDLKKLKDIINKAGFEWFAITCGSGEFTKNSVPLYMGDKQYLEGFKRVEEMRMYFASDWIEAAAELGIKMMRFDAAPYIQNHVIPYSRAFEFNLKRNIEFYKKICEMAGEYGITIGIENHGGFVSDLKVLEELFREVPNLYFVFDFGNVTDDKRYEMIEKFADRCNFVHAKAHIFREDGEEAQIDYGKIIRILKDHGFDGYLSVEWEGPLPGDEGVRKTIDLIKKYL